MPPASLPKYRIYSLITSTKYPGWTRYDHTFLYAQMSLQSTLFQILVYKENSLKSEFCNWLIIHSQPGRQ